MFRPGGEEGCLELPMQDLFCPDVRSRCHSTQVCSRKEDSRITTPIKSKFIYQMFLPDVVYKQFILSFSAIMVGLFFKLPLFPTSDLACGFWGSFSIYVRNIGFKFSFTISLDCLSIIERIIIRYPFFM